MSSAEDPKSTQSKTESTGDDLASIAILHTDHAPKMPFSGQPRPNPSLSPTTEPAHQKPVLPSIVSIDTFHLQPPLVSSSTVQHPGPLHHAGTTMTAPFQVTDQLSTEFRQDEIYRPVRSPHESSKSSWTSYGRPYGAEPQNLLSKRSHDTMARLSESHPQHPPSTYSSSMYPESGAYSYQSTYAHTQHPGGSSASYRAAISRSHQSAAPGLPGLPPASSQRSNNHRLSLCIRQQPRAARAGPDGKDRRAIDPPPILQLLIDDFDVESEEDLAELRSTFFVVHCRLVSAHLPRKDMSALSSTSDDGSTEVQRLLLGTFVASPFYCADDPDIETMPTHPKSNHEPASDRALPSPTSRFIMPKNTASTVTGLSENRRTSNNLPGTFFIFADLSIRRAGEYRLEFCLMKVELANMIVGSTLPILHKVTTQIFKVVNAKDFDQVQPSTDLVKGLLDRGAGFPLKLKKGTREGGRRRHTTESEGGGGSLVGADEDDDDEGEEDDNDEDDDNV